MPGDLLDDELLALAGESDPEDRRKPLAAPTAGSPAHPASTPAAAAGPDDADDADADADAPSSARKRSTLASSSISKRRRLDLLNESNSDMDASGTDDDLPAAAAASHPANRKKTKLRRGGAGAGSDDDDDADEHTNPFPYQGLYKNAQDYEELMEMNELAREEVISERRNLLDERKRQLELRDLYRQQQAAAGATRSKAGTARRQRRNSSDLDQSEDDEDRDAEGESDRDGDGSDYAADAGYAATGGAASAAKSRKKKAVGASDTKTAKLSELRKRRKEKASGRVGARRDSDDEAAGGGAKKHGGRGYRSSSEGRTSESGDDYYEDRDDARYGASPRKPSSSAALAARRGKTSAMTAAAGARDKDRDERREAPSLAELNAVRVPRDLIEQKLYAPKWKEAVVGAFIRFSWGTRPREDGRGEEAVYRIHQVLDVIEKPTRFYDLSLTSSGKWSNVYLVFDHLGKEYEAALTSLSRSPFTESERERWMRTLAAQPGSKMPRKRQLEDKAEELEAFFASVLTEADIARMLEVKKKVRGLAAKCGYALGGAGGARTAGGAGAGRGGAAAGTSANANADHSTKYDQHVMAKMNDWNRKRDRERIVEAERRARMSKAERSKEERQASTPIPLVPISQTVDTSPTKGKLAGVAKVALQLDVDLGDF
ncbi:RNA polymerase-associated protein rtf1 [Thecaphora frezii]